MLTALFCIGIIFLFAVISFLVSAFRKATKEIDKDS